MKQFSVLKTLSCCTDFSLCIMSGIHCCTSVNIPLPSYLQSNVPICLVLLQHSLLPNPLNVNSASLVASLAVWDGYPKSSVAELNKF